MLLATTLCNLVGLCLNMRMLLSSFKGKPRLSFLQARELFVVSQFVAQVTVLVVNSVEAWSELDVVTIRRDESCFALYNVVSTFAIFFSGGNLLAMVAFDSSDTVSYQYQELLPEHLVLAAPALGFLGLGIIWWLSCYSLEFASPEMFVTAFILAATIAVLLFTAWRTRRYHKAPKNPSEATKTVLLETVLLVVVFLMCIGVMTIRISRLPLCMAGDQARAHEKLSYLLVMNYSVGIAIPLTVTDMNDVIYTDKIKVEII